MMSDRDPYSKTPKDQSGFTGRSRQLNLGGASTSKTLDDLRLPGWYRDADGGLCVIYKEHLVSIRFDAASKQYHVCADVLSERGMWEKNVAWETTFDVDEAVLYAMDLIKQLRTHGTFT